MRGTGIIRRIDDLGRIVIPSSVREATGLEEAGTPVEFFINNNSVVLQRYDSETVNTEISTTFLGDGTAIVTQNVDGELYVITAEYFNDILEDMKNKRCFVPADDAPVFFAAWHGKPLNPHCYHDFLSLLEYITKEFVR